MDEQTDQRGEVTCSTSSSQKTVELELEPELIWLLLLHKVSGSHEQAAGTMGGPPVTLETAEHESLQSSALVSVLLKSSNVNDP